MKMNKIIIVLFSLIMAGLSPYHGESYLSIVGAAESYATAIPETPILRIETGQHMALIPRVDLDSTGNWLVSASHDKTVRVWNIPTGKLDKVIRPPIAAGNEGKLYAVAISPNGELIACGGWTKSGSDSGHTVYFFSRVTGRLVGRAEEMSNVVLNMAFSPDGKRLAVTLGGKNGVQLFDIGYDRSPTRLPADVREITVQLAAEDRDYGDSSFGIHFSKDGKRLVTSCDDGFVRMYDLSALSSGAGVTNNGDPVQLRPHVKQRLSPSAAPFNVKFSPDGDSVAVSMANCTEMILLFSENLGVRKIIEAGNVIAGGSSSIAWSPDGQILYTAHPCDTGEHCGTIRGWSASGKDVLFDRKSNATGTILDLATIPNGGLVIASGDPSIIIQKNDKEHINLSLPTIGNFRDNAEGLLISPDGSTFRFGYEAFGKIPATFSLSGRRLSLEPKEDATPVHPLLHTGSLHVDGWKNTHEPTLNNRKLPLDPNELSRSLAITEDSRFVVIGGDWYLRCFDSVGNEVWKTPAPGSVWAVNISSDGRVALAAYGDGTIRWHRMTDGKELMAFFPHADRKRWILWTPEGFFEHSPGGEDLVGWHLNRGRDKEAEFIPVGKLYNRFYRPDLVEIAFEGKDISEYSSTSDIKRLLTTNTLPPKVRLLTPSGMAGTHDTVIKAELCDNGGGIGDITLYLNGMPIIISKNGRGIKISQKDSGSCLQFEHGVTLAEGDNEVSIMAYNKTKTIESNRDSIKLSYSSGGKALPDLYILVVAVNDYRDADLKLLYPIPDATAVAELLKAKSGMLFGKVVVQQLFDTKVTKNGLEEAFTSIGGKTNRNDVFVLFVAGHGITGVKDGAYYFLPYDFRYTEEEAVEQQGISMDNFKGYLASINAMKSLILLDTCNSGSFSEAISSRGLVEKTAISKLTRAVGRATIVASSRNQVALEGYEGHGAFTWTLLDGLKGEAADSNGKITINGLATYVEELLPKITFNKWGFEQIPQRSLQGMDFQIGIK